MRSPLHSSLSCLFFYLILFLNTHCNVNKALSSSQYDVFVSFRGGDTRDTFLSNLYVALDKQGIKVFKDTELERGEEISFGIFKAIEVSRIALIIFSQNYASSSWCLDELVKIMECRAHYKQVVVPVFYRVDPEDVGKQTASYGEALIKHAAEFVDRRKIQTWRDSLRDAAYIAGWDSRNTRPDAVLVEEIAKDAAKKLKQQVPDLRGYGLGGNSYSNTSSTGVKCNLRHATDEKKKKRMISNREALEDLINEVNNIRSKINQLN